jgi:hypothetical protein
MSAVAELDRQPSPASDGPAPAGTEASPSDTAPFVNANYKALPSEAQLLDVLYEVLAQGPAPRSTLTRELVERFLHEHARAKKPVAEMVSFFEKHGLPVSPDEYGSDRELLELASGLQRERSSLVPGFGLAEPEEPATLPPATVEAIRREAAPVEDAISTGKHAAVLVAAPARRGVHWSVYAVACLVLLALGAGFALSYQRAGLLEQRLDQAHMQQRSTDVALTKLEERAEALKGELKQSDQDRRAQQERFEAELAERAKVRAAEEQAVEKVLGVRYTKLRTKLTNEANGVTPAPKR